MDGTLAQLLDALMQQNQHIQQLEAENATLKQQLAEKEPKPHAAR